MRFPILLSALAIVALVLFVPTSSAQNPAPQQMAALGLSDPGALLRMNGDTPDNDSSLYGENNKLGERNFCLKMRTYVVARDHSGSDGTHLVGYTECQPAARFDLRSTRKQTPRLEEGEKP